MNAERRIEHRVHDVDVQAVDVVDRLPVGQRRAAERIDAQREAAALESRPCRRRWPDRGHRAARDLRDEWSRPSAPPPIGTRLTPALPSLSRSFARSSIQRVTSVSAGPPSSGLYLKPPSSGGLCDGVMTMPSARWVVATAVVDEDRARDDGRRRDAIVALDDRLDAVGGQHFERRATARVPTARACPSQDTAAARAMRLPVVADRLRDRQDVRLGEGPRQRRAAMPARAESHELIRVARIGTSIVVVALELREINQQIAGRGLPGQRGDGIDDVGHDGYVHATRARRTPRPPRTPRIPSLSLVVLVLLVFLVVSELCSRT